MNKQTFQELRHECAKKYSPKDWTTSLWADFFGDCMQLIAYGEDMDIDYEGLAYAYNIPKENVKNTVKFIKDNFVI